MSENITQQKSYDFALRVIRLYKFLADEQKEFVLSRHVLSAGTAIGAHVKAAQEAENKNGFTREMQIALQKASETEYWLQLLRDSDFIEEKAFTSIQTDCTELIRLLTAITKSSKKPG
jgi:four helix bundle protein